MITIMFIAIFIIIVLMAVIIILLNYKWVNACTKLNKNEKISYQFLCEMSY